MVRGSEYWKLSYLSQVIVFFLFTFLSCTGERETNARQEFIERKVQERYEVRVQAIMDRCREDNLVIARAKADSLLRKILLDNLRDLVRPGIPSKPRRPAFGTSPLDREVEPIIEEQLLLWLNAYESFVAGDTASVRLYLDSVFNYRIETMQWDSLLLDSLFLDSLFFDNLFFRVLDHY